MPKFNVFHDMHYDYMPEESETGEFEVTKETRDRWDDVIRSYRAMQSEISELVEARDAKIAEVRRLEVAAKQAAYDRKTEPLVKSIQNELCEPENSKVVDYCLRLSANRAAYIIPGDSRDESLSQKKEPT